MDIGKHKRSLYINIQTLKILFLKNLSINQNDYMGAMILRLFSFSGLLFHRCRLIQVAYNTVALQSILLEIQMRYRTEITVYTSHEITNCINILYFNLLWSPTICYHSAFGFKLNLIREYPFLLGTDFIFTIS